MDTKLYRIVYCSRNLIRGNQDTKVRELQGILTKSRTNNERAGITGALIYSAGSFAQVLEGDLPAIERVFEVIQRDARHSDVTVVQIGPIRERQFPEWSMAFAGDYANQSQPQAIAAFDAVFSHAPGGGDAILAMLQNLVATEVNWALVHAA